VQSSGDLSPLPLPPSVDNLDPGLNKPRRTFEAGPTVDPDKTDRYLEWAVSTFGKNVDLILRARKTGLGPVE